MEAHLGALLVRTCRALRSRRARRLAPLGLYCGQDLLLQTLHAEGGLRPSDVAARLDVEPPTVTKMIRRVEEDGLVERTAHPTDARAHCLHLTAAGQALLPHMQACWRALEAEMLRGFTMEERILLRRLLLHVLANLEDPAEGR